MSIGREVADAYIEVHGDLKKFRKDLEKANADIAKASEEAGEESGKSFAEGFEKRRKKALEGKWESTLDALYSNKKLDWDKLVGKFDGNGFDDTRKKVSTFLGDLQKEGVITREEFDKARKALNKQLGVLNQTEKAAKRAARAEKIRAAAQKKYNEDHLVALRLNRDFDRLAAKSRAEANKAMKDRIEVERDWGRAIKQNNAIDAKAMADKERRAKQFFDTTYEGMRKIANERGVEDSFRRMGKAMQDVNWADFAKGFPTLEDAKKRVIAVTEEMNRANRISLGDGLLMINSVNEYVDAENNRAAALQRNAELVEQSRIRQERYNRSLSAAQRAFQGQQVENDFKRISAAMQSMDWSKVTEGARSMYQWNTRTQESVEQMRLLGRVTDTEAARMSRAITTVRDNHRRFNVELDATPGRFNIMGKLIDKMKTSWQRMDSTVKMVLTLIAAGASPIATLGSGLAGAVTAIASSLGMAMNSLVPLAAGVAGLAVGGFLAAKSFAQVEAAFPRISASLDGISAAWSQQAQNFGNEWGASIDSLLNSISVKLAAVDFGTGLGKAFAGITAAFDKIANGGVLENFLTALGGPLAKASEGLGVGLAGAISMVLSWMTAAGPVAESLGNSFAKWGQNLADIASSAAGQERLAAAFEKGRVSLLAILDFAGSLGSALGTLFGLGSSAGNDMLNTLTALVDQWNAWMKTPAGAAEVQAWFEDAKTIMGQLQPVLVGLAQAMDVLVTPQTIAQLGGFMSSIGASLPLLGELLAAISQLDIFGLIGQLLQTVLTAIQPLIAAFGQLGATLSPILHAVIGALGPILSSIASALTPVMNGITQLVGIIGPVLAPAITKIGEAIGPVIAVIGELVGFIIGMLVPVLGPMLTGIINAIVGVIQGLAKVFMGVVEVIKGVVGVIVGIFTGDGQKIKDSFGQIWGGLLDIVTGALQAVWNYIVGMFLGRILGLFKGPLMAIKGVFQSGFNGALAAVKTFVQATWQWMGKLLTNPIATITSGISKLGSVISTGISNVAKFLWEGLLKGLNNGLGAVIAGVVAVGTAILAAIRGFFGIQSPSTVFMEVGQFLLEGLINGIKAFVGMVVNAILEVGTAVLGAATTAFAAVTAFFATVWNGVLAVVSFVWEGIVLAVTTYINLVLLVVTTVWTAISTAITVAVDAISLVINTVFSAIGTFIDAAVKAWQLVISTVWEAIKTAWNTVLEAIKLAVTTVFNAIKLTIETVINAAKTVIDNVLTATKLIFTTIFSAIKSTVTTTFENIRTTITTVINTVKSTISNVLETIKTVFSNAWESVRSTVASAFGRISNGVSEGINNALVFVRELPGKALDALAGIGTKLYSSGSDMILGFVNGVQAMAGRIAGAALEAVGNAVNSVKSFLGIRSPSRLFTTFGKYTGEGYANGMEAMGSMIGTAAQKMADKATEPFSKSKMFIAGQDAAGGLADGLSASKSILSGALGAITTDVGVNATSIKPLSTLPLSKDSERTGPSGGINIEAGAIQIATPTEAPRLVALETMDEIIRFSSNM